MLLKAFVESCETKTFLLRCPNQYEYTRCLPRGWPSYSSSRNGIAHFNVLRYCKTILWHFQFHVLTPSQLNFFAQVFVFLFFRAYFWKFLWWMIFINECRGDWPYCFQKLLLQKQLSFLQTLKWSAFDLFWNHTLMRLKIVE